MEKKGLISIIVPVYNAQCFLAECIESILKQTYSKYELILIDDGSEDSSWEIIQLYSNQYHNITGIRKKNEGPNSARKKGLGMASGEFVMFIDADDYIDELLCDKLIRAMTVYDVDIVIPRVMKTLEGIDIGIIGKWRQGKYTGRFTAENMIDLNMFYKSNMTLGLVANLYKSSILKNIFATVDEKIQFSEDFSCHILALLDAKYVYFIDECLYYYRQNSGSIMHNHVKSNFTSEQYVYRFLMPEFKKRKVSPNVYKQLEWIIIFSLLIGGYETFVDKKYLYPFKNVSRGSKIIIYGAGVFGQALYDFIKQYHLYELVLWVDKNYRIYQNDGFPVCEIDQICESSFDYIVLALLKIDVAMQVKEELKKRSIDAEKIELIDQKLISYQELPQSFFESGDAGIL